MGPLDIYLANRFQVAERLFSNRLQMTSKLRQEQKSDKRGAAVCVTDDVIYTSVLQ